MNVKELRPIIVGGGNLGGAVARGLHRAGLSPVVVELAGPNFDKLAADGLKAVNDLEDALNISDGPVFIALKPWLMKGYCEENSALLAGRLCVSCAAMVDLAVLKAAAPKASWGRIMTNIGAAVGAAFTGVVRGDWDDGQAETVRSLCLAFGDAEFAAEKDLDAITGLSGSGIAYVLELLEGFIQGGLAVGLKGDLSRRVGVATVLGAAELVRESGVHPAILKDNVCTPGGTTIAGIRALQKSGFRSAFIEALVATAEKSKAGSEAFRAAAGK
jgi:pyrroline-5-carboxylate reductase